MPKPYAAFATATRTDRGQHNMALPRPGTFPSFMPRSADSTSAKANRNFGRAQIPGFSLKIYPFCKF